MAAVSHTGIQRIRQPIIALRRLLLGPGAEAPDELSTLGEQDTQLFAEALDAELCLAHASGVEGVRGGALDPQAFADGAGIVGL